MSRLGTIFDVAILESLNGGDLFLLGNDLAVVKGNENQHYLAMFGGNVESNTPSIFTGNERNDYWGNALLWAENETLQFNSNTERVLNTTPLTSAGRLTIENAVKNDLKFLSSVAEVTVAVTFPNLNTVQINIVAIYKTGEKVVTTFSYVKIGDGDFSYYDFNSDFA